MKNFKNICAITAMFVIFFAEAKQIKPTTRPGYTGGTIPTKVENAQFKQLQAQIDNMVNQIKKSLMQIDTVTTSIKRSKLSEEDKSRLFKHGMVSLQNNLGPMLSSEFAKFEEGSRDLPSEEEELFVFDESIKQKVQDGLNQIEDLNDIFKSSKTIQEKVEEISRLIIGLKQQFLNQQAELHAAFYNALIEGPAQNWNDDFKSKLSTELRRYFDLGQ